jgi:hypothetical protein
MSDAIPESPELQEADKFDHLAGECACHQRMADAASYYRQSLAIRERVLGPDHHEVADSLVRLAAVLGWDDKEHPEYEPLFRRAAGIYDRVYRDRLAAKDELFGHAVMSLEGALGTLAARAFQRGNLHEAEQGYRRIQTMIVESYGPDFYCTSPTLPTFATVLIQLGKEAEAEELLRKVVDRMPRLGSMDKWIHHHCQTILADLYAKRDRLVEAESLYRQAIEFMERASRPSLPMLISTIESLAGLCRKTGREPEAERLERQTQQLRSQKEHV